MTISEKVQAILIADAALIALVPAARIKVYGNYQNLARPYIVHRLVSGGPSRYTHEGAPTLKEWDFYQVSVFADNYSTGEAAAFAVVEALKNYRQDGVIIFWQPGAWHVGRDPDVNVEHFAPQFRIAETL